MPLTFPSVITTFSTPLERWDEVFHLMPLTFPSVVTEFPGCQSVYVFAAAEGGTVEGQVLVNWDTVPERDAWLANGYTAASMLAELNPPLTAQAKSVERIF
jgi:hypothetical protein